ncbi:uncharacterized protein G2W53_040744 [Senna tora]|uniref:Uncharacterized protein n=1 Tax=Senna tora TaxID=362788 RepID=A0A834VXF4_9FABA|nr:uncharacterized protein G2W53_040744 [Senna tora]
MRRVGDVGEQEAKMKKEAGGSIGGCSAKRRVSILTRQMFRPPSQNTCPLVPVSKQARAPRPKAVSAT